MKALKISLWVLIGVIASAVIFFGTLTIFEYRPRALQAIAVDNNQANLVRIDTVYQVMTFNIGYAGLGKAEDFVMDGGRKGRPDSKSVVEGYFEGIKAILRSHESDFYFLQEVDQKSRRSYGINQVEGIRGTLGASYASQFAYNFKAIFVPFPLSFTDYLGPVKSGIQTLAKHKVERSERHQFPGAFSWPLRIANLKRAMLVSYMDIEGSKKKLVLVNLHLSAYDSDGSMRSQEMAALSSFLEAQRALGNYVIVGGDFNQTFPEAAGLFPVQSDLYEAYTIEKDFLPSGYRFAVDLSHPTCRLLNQPYVANTEGTQYYVVDGFIISDTIELLAIDSQTTSQPMTIDQAFLYSDHNPVVMRFRLKGSSNNSISY
ncbi:endonuclease subunit UvrC [Treponema sp.]